MTEDLKLYRLKVPCVHHIEENAVDNEQGVDNDK